MLSDMLLKSPPFGFLLKPDQNESVQSIMAVNENTEY